MAYASPYLLHLGLSKSNMSLVWIVGPLSGLVTQPIVGVMADRSKSRWGRRRPVMVIGSILTAIALLCLGWTAEIVGLFFKDQGASKTITIVVAVLSMYLLDFSVNAVQACCRALIVDSLPTDQQQHGNAWASRMIAVGNVGGYLAGAINLMKIFGTSLGDTQFKQLTVLCSIALAICIGVTCFAVSERVLVERRAEDSKSGLSHIFRLIWKTIWHMPKRIAAICLIIFFAWIGWFPFMVYGTTFVGEVLKRYDPKHGAVGARSFEDFLEKRSAVFKRSDDNMGDITRVGSMALVLFSCVSLASSFALPWVIVAPETDDEHKTTTPQWRWVSELLIKLEPYRPDLATAWIIGHVAFAMLMFTTLFTKTVVLATFIVAACGVPWSLMTWAPFSFVGEEISKLGAEQGDHSGSSSRSHSVPAGDTPRSHDPLLAGNEYQDSPGADSRRSFGSVEPSPVRRVDTDEETLAEPSKSSSSELAGVYLGILNVFTCLPQFVATFISFIIFQTLEPGKSPEFGDGPKQPPPSGVNAIAVVLGIGGISTLCAAHYTMQFKYDRRYE